MTARTLALASVLAASATFAAAYVVLLPRLSEPPAAPVPPAPATPADDVDARKITAHLFFVAEDGLRLASIEREVVFGEDTVEQARRILEAQLEPAPPPYASAIPPGTTLHRVFVTDRGEAFVDVSAEVRSAHPGGSLNELFTTYTIVNALTANLPAVTAVQILIDGKEVDSLAGHLDLRRPLQQNDRLVAGPSQ